MELEGQPHVPRERRRRVPEGGRQVARLDQTTVERHGEQHVAGREGLRRDEAADAVLVPRERDFTGILVRHVRGEQDRELPAFDDRGVVGRRCGGDEEEELAHLCGSMAAFLVLLLAAMRAGCLSRA